MGDTALGSKDASSSVQPSSMHEIMVALKEQSCVMSRQTNIMEELSNTLHSLSDSKPAPTHVIPTPTVDLQTSSMPAQKLVARAQWPVGGFGSSLTLPQEEKPSKDDIAMANETGAKAEPSSLLAALKNAAPMQEMHD